MKVFRKVFLWCLCLTLLWGGSLQAAIKQPVSMPDFSHINLIATTFEINPSGSGAQGQIWITASVSARNVTSVEQRIQLQRWNGSSWANVPDATWTRVDQGTIGYFETKSYNVPTGLYRFIDHVAVYDNGVVVERVDHVSKEAKY